ncbi:MAG: carbohydrate kinase [Lautropia sp.]|nr:carbohydrate kinase [Lautropia sp.]
MKITSFGEVLWDNLPSGKVLGGAPLNVLVRLRALGADCAIISSRGNDANGEALLEQIQEKDVATRFLQICPDQPTSLVEVSINNCGVASYDIVYPCAWDRIEIQANALERVAESDAFVYGSLCARDPVTRHTLETVLDKATAANTFRVFDVNMRPPHYTHERIVSLMKRADLVKLNDDELYELAVSLGSRHRSIDQNVRFLAKYAGVNQVCVTLGPHGALYFAHDEMYFHTGFRVEVADTVGSGDSFLAGLLYKQLNGASPDESLDFACALGALVATHIGPTPQISAEEIERFRHPV